MTAFALPESQLQTLRRLAQQQLSDSRGSHDLEHTLRVYTLCQHIGQPENADLEILKIAALLHDIARHEQDRQHGKVCHAQLGAERAGSILAEMAIPPAVIQRVQHCIQSHRFRNDHTPQSLEARVLFDADKLDGIGAVGIGRAFLFAGEIGAKLHNDGQTDVLSTQAYSREDTAYREYMIKLRHIKDKMLTPTGEKMAVARHQFMVNFFEQLIHECSGDT